jgi:hypothetical protein
MLYRRYGIKIILPACLINAAPGWAIPVPDWRFNKLLKILEPVV